MDYLERVGNMSIVITNGEYYILHTVSGGIETTNNQNEADSYPSVYKAIVALKRFLGETKEYYVYDTETEKICWKKYKRKKYSQTVRKMVYNKSGGHCELCGREIQFSEMTLDHIIPLAQGGADNKTNLQCTCRACNTFKGHILPEDFMHRITEIYLYQMSKKNGDKFMWKIVRRYLEMNI